MDQDPTGPDRSRDETEAEREDRKWNDMLQELRVLQTSAQLTAGFLLTLPFQERFEELSDSQEALYLVLVVLAAVTTALVLTPVAIHRRLAGRRIKGRVVEAGHVLMRLAIGALALLVVGTVALVYDVATSLSAAVTVGVALAALLLGLLVVLPRLLTRR